MRLPSKLLGCMRVGVGVGAVMLGGGCDAVAEAKARVLGEEQAEVAAEAVAEAPVAASVAEARVAPEPMLLNRDGVAGVVEDTLARSKTADARSSTIAPVVDLDRPRTEPESSHAFVPFAGSGGGAIAGAPPTPEREPASSKPRLRPRPKLARPVEDEPCDPVLAAPVTTPKSGAWSCGPCGRG